MIIFTSVMLLCVFDIFFLDLYFLYILTNQAAFLILKKNSETTLKYLRKLKLYYNFFSHITKMLCCYIILV